MRSRRVDVFTIDNASSANALSTRVVRELQDWLDDAATNSDVGAVVLRGAGERHFSAGADLAEADMDGLVDGLRRVVATLRSLPVPSIAAVNGACIGGGFELALACDIRLSGQSSTFGLPEIGFGALPGAGGLSAIARVAGQSTAVLLGIGTHRIDAKRAADLGLVDRVVADPVAEGVLLGERLAAQDAGLTATALDIVRSCWSMSDREEYARVDAALNAVDADTLMEKAAASDSTYRKFAARARESRDGGA